MLNLLHCDGYSLGEVRTIERTGYVWHLDAYKDGERFLAFHEDRDIAAAMLMGICGWDYLKQRCFIVGCP